MPTSAVTVRNGVATAIEAIVPTTPGDLGTTFHALDLVSLDGREGTPISADDRGYVLRFQGGDTPLGPTSQTEKRVQRQLQLRVLYWLPQQDQAHELDGRIEDDAADIENAVNGWLHENAPGDVANVEMRDDSPAWGDGWAGKTFDITIDIFRAA